MAPGAFASAPPSVQPLVVQTHILKTGGTALRQLVNANYRRDEVVHLEGLDIGPAALERREHSSSAHVQAWRDYYAALAPEEKCRVRCYCGHQAPFLIKAIDDRPVKAFCMLREPVDRVVSSYLFMLWSAERLPASDPVVQVLTAMTERGWTVADLYRQLGGDSDYRAKLVGLDELAVGALVATFFNGQARHLLAGEEDIQEMPLAGDCREFESYRARVDSVLSQRYVVGTQDRFSQSVRLFADSFGWRRVFVPRVNVGRLRGGHHEAEIDDETLSLIRRYNQVDAELHGRYAARLSTMPTVGRVAELRTGARRTAARARARVRARGRPRRAV